MISLALFKQIAIFFLMMAGGFAVVKAGVLQAKDSRILSLVTIYIINPCVLIHAFQIEYSAEVRNGFLLSIAAAVLINGVLILVTKLFGKLFSLDVVERASIIYSNCGNLVIPLVMAILGEEWVIYASGYMCVQNILLWTHCTSLLAQRKHFDFKKVFLNINIISIAIGVLLFFAKIQLPEILGTAMSSVSATIGPVSMVMIGMTMASVKWKEVLSNWRVYVVTFLKMIVCPLIVLALCKFLPLHTLVPEGRTVLLISMIGAITPSAVMVVQLCQLHQKRPDYASAINVVTTLVCIVTMPLVVMLYSL